MSGVKRYGPTCDCMSEISWGDYVLASDYDRDVRSLREEVDRQADDLDEITADRDGCAHQRDALAADNKRLRELLMRVQVSMSLDDTEWGYSGAEKYKLLTDIRAALASGKEVGV